MVVSRVLAEQNPSKLKKKKLHQKENVKHKLKNLLTEVKVT